ncbi:hypothetical protein [Acaryochloris sp. CCMEE 5410]|nr:hypothetical protein [Acaryochloris sp. CCMEE 5410]KAI9134425.1 hypothetical protein ON05_014835 [Acaryochloris sp. CCMEE 5410]
MAASGRTTGQSVFETLDDLEDVLEQRCRTLMTMQSDIKALTQYHWWPA